MAITISSEVMTLMNAYDLPWPDVDEDAFLEMQSPLREFGSDVQKVGESIDEALRLLNSSNPSQTLPAIVVYLQAIKSDFLQPIDTVCSELAGLPCTTAYDAIVALKGTLLGMLTYEVTNDAFDLVATFVTVGADAPATLAEAAAVKEALSLAANAAVGEISSLILHAAASSIGNFVDSVVNPFINRVVEAVEGAVDSYMPRLVLLASSELGLLSDPGGGGRLHLDEHELERCIGSIATSSYHLEKAATKLTSAIEELFSHPSPEALQIPSASSALRVALREVVHHVEQDFVGKVRVLIDAVIKHFIALLRDFRTALADLDEQARALAAREQAASVPLVNVVSAAGVGAAAAQVVSAASANVDASEADGVSVETVYAVEQTDAVVGRVDDTPLVKEAAATAEEVGEDLNIRVARPKASVETAAPGAVTVDSLHVPGNTEGPHVAAAQTGEVPLGTVSGQVNVHQTAHAGDAAGSAASRASAQPGVNVAHHDLHEPTVTTAESTAAHGVGQMDASGKDMPGPVVAPADSNAETGSGAD